MKSCVLISNIIHGVGKARRGVQSAAHPATIAGETPVSTATAPIPPVKRAAITAATPLLPPTHRAKQAPLGRGPFSTLLINRASTMITV